MQPDTTGANQKIRLCQALLAIGTWTHAQDVSTMQLCFP